MQEVTLLSRVERQSQQPFEETRCYITRVKMVFVNSKARLRSKCPKKFFCWSHMLCAQSTKKGLLILKGTGLTPNPPSRAVTLLI